MRAVKLKTAYLHNPLGIDIAVPRLFWNCSGGVTQTAYQVVCRDDAGNALWDSHHAGAICGKEPEKP